MSLFNARDLMGWKADKDSWKVEGGKFKNLKLGGELISEKQFDNAELIFDWRLPGKEDARVTTTLGSFTMLLDPSTGTSTGGQGPGNPICPARKVELKPGAWGRTVMTLSGTSYSMTVNGTEIGTWVGKELPAGPIKLPSPKAIEIMNVFVRELKEKK
ncbi:MAG: family 16 glycoside hydrolase [Gemmataceae bacterium]